MGIIRNKLSYFYIKKRDCRQLRAQLAVDTPISLPDGSSFVFLNRLTYYDTILNIQGTLATVEELAGISRVLNIYGYALCPMTVWSSKNDIPLLVKINTGHKKPVKVIRTPSLYCLAFAFFIIPEEK
jgi:hypothetical protein